MSKHKRETRITTLNATDIGCHIDSHHGHYAIPMVIELGVRLGYILDPFARYVLDRYETDCHSEDYPMESLYEEQNRVQEWLNQIDGDERISGQNFAPTRPEGCFWDWNDGDFGLYPEEVLGD